MAGLVVAVLLAGCTGGPPPTSSPSTGTEVTAGRTSVGPATGPALPGLTVTEAALGADEQRALSDWGDVPMAAGRPSEVRLEGALPPEGVRITRRYERPLPPDAAATLAYFDTDLDAWVAVPSEVAADRLSVSAVVHHLSLWNDFVSGTQQAMQAVGDAATSAADWAYYNVGKVFDTRVDPPTCSTKKPDWVDSTTFIETQRNNSVLFCTGTDEAKPGILTIKARVNRGFGFNAEVTGKPAWTHNSSFDRNDLDQAFSVLSELDKVLADSMRDLTSDGRMTAPGQEYSIGLSEQEARKLPSFLALRLTPQPVLPFLVTTLGQLAGTDLTNRADGLVAAAMVTAKCSKDVREASDGARLTKAALSCVGGIDGDIAKQLALYLLKRGVKDPGKVAGKVVGKVSVYLACIGPVFNGMNYWAEQNLIEDARTVHVFPTTIKVLLAPSKVGRFPFGTPYKTVETELRKLLGAPDHVSEDAGCEMNPIWTRNLRWNRFWVAFEAKQPTKTDQMFLSHWGLARDGTIPPGVKVVDALPVTTTFTQLRRTYPKITIEDLFDTGAGPYISELGNNVTYDWTDAKGTAVESLMSGPLRPCE